MTYVVTKPCIGTKDRACVEVCPVDCFYDIRDPKLNEKYGIGPAEWAGEDDPEKRGYGMLVIHPDECINCGACETECPVEAIYEDTAVPEEFKEFTKLNADITLSMSDDELDSTRITSRD
ncbi:MAG: ferredoxin family protein [Candidatus Dadabacteria bacterium]|nr:MAG: ferredoxin family protein [Candidatus Dadabacteria bacterium]